MFSNFYCINIFICFYIVLYKKMGQTGSYTRKGEIKSCLLSFTKWDNKRINSIYLRSQKELSDVFALRWNEFEFLCSNLISFYDQRELFNNVFDTDNNKLIDKLEVMCVIILISALSTLEKIEYLFELFNFNEKGYLTRSEVSLLIITVVTSIYKIDSNYIIPSKPIIENILNTSFLFAKFNINVLRKPELIAFIAETEVVRLYLDTFRGISSQVLLPSNDFYIDNNFISNISIITPSLHWFNKGLPPEIFIKWLRLRHIGLFGSTIGGTSLFTHTITTLKTADKKLVYSGLGVIAQGTLQQGFLADRWLMNAISLLISKPIYIQRLFSNTGQEDDGRYCINLFEGLSWRTIFIDDIIPCGPTYEPIFLNSSDINESWILLLEKAIAKYLSSYGYIGHCSSRYDSTLKAIQWLTGGHPIIYSIDDYEWKSISADVLLKDGTEFITKLYEEGSFISFARSECLLQIPKTNNMLLNNIEYPPHGRLFPIVNIHTDELGYKIITIKDIYGLYPNITHLESPDLNSGHCRVAFIKVEDIPNLFDMLIISRFPDATRMNAKALNLKPWKTLISRASSEGIKQPARFRLQIENKLFDYENNKNIKNNYMTPEEFRKQKIAEISLKSQKDNINLKDLENLYKEQYSDIAFTISRYIFF